MNLKFNITISKFEISIIPAVFLTETIYNPPYYRCLKKAIKLQLSNGVPFKILIQLKYMEEGI
jgi:hypothetical protein